MLEILNRLRSLSGRERVLIWIAVSLIVVFLFVQFVVLPVFNSRNIYIERVELLEERFNQMKLLAGRYNTVFEEYLAIKKQIEAKDTTPVLTYIDNLASGEGLRENIDYIKPRGEEKEGILIGSRVEIKVDAIEPDKLIRFINSLEEQRRGLIVTSIRLKPYFKEKGKFDVILQVTDYSLAGE